MCKRAQLGVMGKEEEGRTDTPGLGKEFITFCGESSVRRMLYHPSEGECDDKDAEASKEPVDHSGHIDLHRSSSVTPNG
jgi:hypothetical protein